jgi:hypothetical protein
VKQAGNTALRGNQLRRIIKSTPRIAIGVKLALAMMAHGKVAAISPVVDISAKTSSNGRNKKVVQLAEDCLNTFRTNGKQKLSRARAAWSSLVFAAGNEIKTGTPMSYDEVRLFLQSYNAGPYACLKYKGTVPYRETRNYVPRIMKYYQQDLSQNEYDTIIVEKALKYGLDPQLVRAIVKTESNFNHRTVSHAGARGLMQVMPVVWQEMCKRYRFKWNYDSDVFDPEKNVEIACAYLAWLRYDFLPRHFQEFPANPDAPVIVKRDKRSLRNTARISAREQTLVTQQPQQAKSPATPGA